MTQLFDASCKIAQADVCFPQFVRCLTGLLVVFLTKGGILIFELFPVFSLLFQFPFRLFQGGVTIRQPGNGRLQLLFCPGDNPVPVRLSRIGEEGHHLPYLFQTLVQCRIPRFQQLQCLIRLLNRHKPCLISGHRLVSDAYLFPFSCDGRFQGGDALRAGTSPFRSGFLFLADLLL